MYNCSGCTEPLDAASFDRFSQPFGQGQQKTFDFVQSATQVEQVQLPQCCQRRRADGTVRGNMSVIFCRSIEGKGIAFVSEVGGNCLVAHVQGGSQQPKPTRDAEQTDQSTRTDTGVVQGGFAGFVFGWRQRKGRHRARFIGTNKTAVRHLHSLTHSLFICGQVVAGEVVEQQVRAAARARRNLGCFGLTFGAHHRGFGHSGDIGMQRPQCLENERLVHR